MRFRRSTTRGRTPGVLQFTPRVPVQVNPTPVIASPPQNVPHVGAAAEPGNWRKAFWPLVYFCQTEPLSVVPASDPFSISAWSDGKQDWTKQNELRQHLRLVFPYVNALVALSDHKKRAAHALHEMGEKDVVSAACFDSWLSSR
jgi:hypothetical protein